MGNFYGFFFVAFGASILYFLVITGNFCKDDYEVVFATRIAKRDTVFIMVDSSECIELDFNFSVFFGKDSVCCDVSDKENNNNKIFHK